MGDSAERSHGASVSKRKVNTMADVKAKVLDPQFLFVTLAGKIKGRADMRQRIDAHIRAATGHNDLEAFHNNGATEKEKVEVYQLLLRAVLKDPPDYKELLGDIPKGQATSDAEVAPKAAPAPEAVTVPEPAAPTDDVGKAIAAALAPFLGGKSPVDKNEVARIAAEICKTRMSELEVEMVGKIDKVRVAMSNRVDEYIKNIPARDCIQIKKWDGTVTEITGLYHKQLPELIKLMTSRNSIGWSEFVYIWGAAGAGKTHLLKQLGKALGVQHYPYPCGPTTTEGKILGFNNIANGTFVKGWLYEPYKNGGLVGFDEIDLSDPSVLGGCNSIENEEFTFGNGETVQRHKDFYLVAFANTMGTGATGGFTRNKLDAATLDRFTTFKLEYDAELESKLFGNPKWAAYVGKVREYVEKNCNNSFYVTPRATRKGAAYLANGIPAQRVADMCLFGRCSESVKQAIINSIGAFKG